MKLITEATDTTGILTRKLKPVTDIKAAVRMLDGMIPIMHREGGIGLTASQVGIDAAMFVMLMSNGTVESIINQIVEAESRYTTIRKESCLSYPDRGIAEVKRPNTILVSYHNGKNYVHRRLDKMEAVIFMHEMDHVNGHCSVLDK